MPIILVLIIACIGFINFAYGAPSPGPASDPCLKIANQAFMLPADAQACQETFPFNETLRQNVLSNVARVFDFFTFESYYLDSPAPFQESTTNIREQLARINQTEYSNDFEFSWDLFLFTTQLNDGHTRWFPTCYTAFQNILPAPIVTLEEDGNQNVFIAPDSVEFISLLGSAYTDILENMGFDWRRLAGAKVVSIQGQDPYAFVDHIASTISGNYLDHGVRVNSVFSSYRISGTTFSQRLGDFAGPTSTRNNSVTMEVVVANSTSPETVEVPFVASYLGLPFTDADSFWELNCVATEDTNGIDLRTIISQGALVNISDPQVPTRPARERARGDLFDVTRSTAIGLPGPFLPTLEPTDGSSGVIKSFILPDGITGVMFIGSFSGDFDQFQTDTVAAIGQFKRSGVTRLLIDLSNNGGGFVCLGQFLHRYLAGSGIGDPGFQSTMRGNELARKIVAADIAQGLNSSFIFYAPDNWAFLNGTIMPENNDYMTPPVPLVINGQQDPTSQRFLDTCELSFITPLPNDPPFDLKNVAIVGNGNCASTCAMFSTLMNERHNTTIAIFGGKPGESMEFKGMAGNQVLEWADLDTEIKTAGVKDDALAPPDLLVNGNFRHNWRTAWSFFDEATPIAYKSELPKLRFAYTNETYNNPQNLWIYASSQIFGQ